MKTKNNLTTGILIGIGMIVIPLIIMSSKPISSTNNEITYGTPESHVWEIGGDQSDVYMFNKVTGEVRVLSGLAPVKIGYLTLTESTSDKAK